MQFSRSCSCLIINWKLTVKKLKACTKPFSYCRFQNFFKFQVSNTTIVYQSEISDLMKYLNRFFTFHSSLENVPIGQRKIRAKTPN